MGNACCTCASPSGIQECCPWFFQTKANLPPKAETVDRPKPVGPSDPANKDFLALTNWNYELQRNGETHHTSSYSHMQQKSPPSGKPEGTLVIRRGQSFYLTLTTNIPYNSETHKIALMFFVVGSPPNFGNSTQVGVKVGAEEDNDGWWAKIHDQTDTNLTLEVKSSASAIVGEWKLEVDVDSHGKIHCFDAPSNFFLLFNAWCSDDAVFLDGEEERNEYVLSDVGLIWRGTHDRLRPCPWQFGQYEKDVLECVLYVLHNLCKMLPANRADAMKVVRAISAGVNSPDDAGVLVGNWSSSYTGGTAPTEWRGSTDILQQFYQKKQSVKFGQCWVFSGVVTSACRAVGIPCRPVTNFSSAHDTHNSLTIDYFCGDDGKVIESLNADSVWNFHVWNEVWMTRPDLGPDYGGWQVIDATPQELSDGQYRCGPTSLVAVKRGEIQLAYDVPFVYAEINADTLYWKYQGERQPMKLLGRKTGGIGLNISTKAIGKMQREDITELYKHREDSTAERTVMVEALRRCENAFARYYLNEEFEEVEFDMQLKDDIVIGQPFSIVVKMENKSINEHGVALVLRADTMLYTGTIKDLVKKSDFSVILKPRSTQEVKLDISFDEYYKKLVDQCAFNISCLGKVTKTNFEYFAQDDFRVRKPDIEIKCLTEKVRVGKPSSWTATFKNPLPMDLNNGRFQAVPSNSDSTTVKLKKKVGINEDASFDFIVTPKRLGEMTVSVTFSSKELEDVDGYVVHDVKDGTEDDDQPTTRMFTPKKEDEEEVEKEEKEKTSTSEPTE